MDLLRVFSVLCLLCLCARLFTCALWSPAGKGLTSWLSFVVSNCEFVTFPLVSWLSLTDLLILITASSTGTHALALSFPRLNLRKLHHIIRFIITVRKIRHNTVLGAILFLPNMANILLSYSNNCLFHALDPIPA